MTDESLLMTDESSMTITKADHKTYVYPSHTSSVAMNNYLYGLIFLINELVVQFKKCHTLICLG